MESEHSGPRHRCPSVRERGLSGARLPASSQACASPHGCRPQGNGRQSTAMHIIVHRHRGPVTASLSACPSLWAFARAASVLTPNFRRPVVRRSRTVKESPRKPRQSPSLRTLFHQAPGRRFLRSGRARSFPQSPSADPARCRPGGIACEDWKSGYCQSPYRVVLPCGYVAKHAAGIRRNASARSATLRLPSSRSMGAGRPAH